MQMYKKFRDEYDGVKYTRYTSEDTDIIKFDYQYGKTGMFIKYKDDKTFLPCIGNSGSFTSDRLGDGTIKERFQTSPTNVLAEREYKRDLKIFASKGKCTVVTGSLYFDLDLVENSSSIKDLEFIDLPIIREVKHINLDRSTGMYYILANVKYNSTYDTHTLILFDPITNTKVDKEITDFVRYRDGGTTFVTFGEDVLYYPTPFDGTLSDTLNEEPIHKIPIDFIMDTKLLEALSELNIEHEVGELKSRTL